MNRSIFRLSSILLFLVSPFLIGSTTLSKPKIKVIRRYDIQESPYLRSIGVSADGIGSGLTYYGKDELGRMVFYGLTDRGPNLFSPFNRQNEFTITYMNPAFKPYYGRIVVDGKRAILESKQHFRFGDEIASGLFLDYKHWKSDNAIDFKTGELLAGDRHGLDTESIDRTGHGTMWIGEEYGPSLLEIEETTGQVLRRLYPGEGLPEILKNRQTNKGFEAVAINPNGKIYAAMEGTLDIDGKTKNKAAFMRILELDPKTGTQRMLAYPYSDDPDYLRNSKIKVGDMTFYDETHLMLIEQGLLKSDKMHNAIYIADISQADDLNKFKTRDGEEMEFAKESELENLKMLKKRLIFEREEITWPHAKMEGLAKIDNQTIAITNDNDFGMDVKISMPDGTVGQWEEFRIDIAEKQLYQKGALSDAKIEAVNNMEPSHLWIIEFDKPLIQAFDEMPFEEFRP